MVARKGFSVSFNTSITLDTAFKLPEFQNEYGQGNSGQFAFVNGLEAVLTITFLTWGPRLNQGLLSYARKRNKDTDNLSRYA
jgi:hypothetical protein